MYIVLETKDLNHIIPVWDDKGKTIIWNDPVKAKKWGEENLQDPIVIDITLNAPEADGIYEVISISRDDIENAGFDTSNVDEKDIQEWAESIGESINENDLYHYLNGLDGLIEKEDEYEE